MSEGLVQSEPYDLTAVSMPPEMYDVEEDGRESGEGRTSSIAFFAEDVSHQYFTKLRVSSGYSSA